MTRRAEDREGDKGQEHRVQARDDRGARDPGVAENLRNVHRCERQASGSVVQRLAQLERKKTAKQIQSHHFFPYLDEPSFAGRTDGSQRSGHARSCDEEPSLAKSWTGEEITIRSPTTWGARWIRLRQPAVPRWRHQFRWTPYPIMLYGRYCLNPLERGPARPIAQRLQTQKCGKPHTLALSRRSAHGDKTARRGIPAQCPGPRSS